MLSGHAVATATRIALRPALTATEAVFLKRAVLAASPLATFAGWCLLGLVVSVPVLLLGRRGLADQARAQRDAAGPK